MTNVEFVESSCTQSFSHIIMCVLIYVWGFFPLHSPVGNSQCNQGGVIQTCRGNKALNPASSSVATVVCLEAMCLIGACSKTAPGVLRQTRFPAADRRVCQRSGICWSCEQHPGRGPTCHHDPSASPLSACVLNRSSADQLKSDLCAVSFSIRRADSTLGL